MEQWQNRLATEDNATTADSLHGGLASSVDDYGGYAEERVDYEEVSFLGLKFNFTHHNCNCLFSFVPTAVQKPVQEKTKATGHYCVCICLKQLLLIFHLHIHAPYYYYIII